jgi:hypothetical protein
VTSTIPSAPRDVEAEARAALDPVHWDFFAGGAGEERTLRANEAAFRRRHVIPQVLRAGSKPETRVDLYGDRLPHPILIAPTAFHLLAHPRGERGTAEAGRGGADLRHAQVGPEGVPDGLFKGVVLLRQAGLARAPAMSCARGARTPSTHDRRATPRRS